eukprot:188386-Amphidinium_carterae.1
MHRYPGLGRTAWELRKGRSYRRKLPQFSEVVMAMPVGKRHKLDYRAYKAIFLGLDDRSDMALVAQPLLTSMETFTRSLA